MQSTTAPTAGEVVCFHPTDAVGKLPHPGTAGHANVITNVHATRDPMPFSQGKSEMTDHTPVQHHYPDDVAHCYGCGRLNTQGLHIKSTWDGDETCAILTPRPEHIAVPGYVYGGLIASLIDCHGTGSAALAMYRAEQRDPGSDPPLRFVTASLKVDFLRPTPLGPSLEARGCIAEVGPRKVIVDIDVAVEGQVCAKGRVIAVKFNTDALRPAQL